MKVRCWACLWGGGGGNRLCIVWVRIWMDPEINISRRYVVCAYRCQYRSVSPTASAIYVIIGGLHHPHPCSYGGAASVVV